MPPTLSGVAPERIHGRPEGGEDLQQLRGVHAGRLGHLDERRVAVDGRAELAHHDRPEVDPERSRMAATSSSPGSDPEQNTCIA